MPAAHHHPPPEPLPASTVQPVSAACHNHPPPPTTTQTPPPSSSSTSSLPCRPTISLHFPLPLSFKNPSRIVHLAAPVDKPFSSTLFCFFFFSSTAPRHSPSSTPHLHRSFPPYPLSSFPPPDRLLLLTTCVHSNDDTANSAFRFLFGRANWFLSSLSPT